MHFNKYTAIFGATGVLLMLAGCAVTPSHTSGASAKSVPRVANPQFDQALTLMRSGHYAEAIPLLEAMLKQNAKLSTVALNLAIAQARIGHDPAAEPLLRQVVAQQPGAVVAWNELGMLLRRAGNFAEARKAYEQALAVNPDYPEAQLNLGILFDLYLQQPAQAVAHYQRFQSLTATPDKQVTLWIAHLSKALPPTQERPQK